MKITEQWATGLTAAARAIRIAVFVAEQGYPIEEEFDAADAAARQVVLLCDGQPAATGRVVAAPGSAAHIGRIAVLPQYRACGMGRRLVAALEREAAAQGAREIALGAQVQAAGFYERCGYRICGAQYMDGHVPHVPMKKSAYGC